MLGISFVAFVHDYSSLRGRAHVRESLGPRLLPNQTMKLSQQTSPRGGIALDVACLLKVNDDKTGVIRIGSDSKKKKYRQPYVSIQR